MATGVKKRGDKWDAWIKLGGKVHWGRGFDSQREAVDWRDEKVRERKNNIELLPARLTVEKLIERHFELYGKTVKATTHDKDVERFERYVLPDPISKRPARAVMRTEVQAFVNRLERAYTTATAKKVHALLRKVYLMSVENEELLRTPTKGIKFGSHSVELDVPTLEETAELIAAVRPEFRDAVTFASLTGMRRGEIVALRWTSVNHKKGFIRVRQTAGWVKRSLLEKPPEGDSKNVLVEWEPKTDAGKREVIILAETAALLRGVRDDQLETKKALGDAWNGSGGYVFTRPDGRQLDPNELSRSVTEAARSLGRRYRFHDLRHAFVTRCVEVGIPAAIVAGMVGHTDAGFTQRTYFDGNPEQQRAAGATLDAFFDAYRVSNGLQARHEDAGDGEAPPGNVTPITSDDTPSDQRERGSAGRGDRTPTGFRPRVFENSTPGDEESLPVSSTPNGEGAPRST